MNLFDGILRFDSNHGSFHCQHIKIELGEKAQRIKTIAGNAEQVVLGVRPENILIDSNNSAPPISAKTVSVDRLGDSTVVHLESMNHMKNEPINIVVRANAGSSINRGDVVSLQLDLDAAHWFDAQTGENLQQKQNQR
jgi:multiple sugar transport system ATP-binding protein